MYGQITAFVPIPNNYEHIADKLSSSIMRFIKSILVLVVDKTDVNWWYFLQWTFFCSSYKIKFYFLGTVVRTQPRKIYLLLYKHKIKICLYINHTPFSSQSHNYQLNSISTHSSIIVNLGYKYSSPRICLFLSKVLNVFKVCSIFVQSYQQSYSYYNVGKFSNN